MFKGTKKYVLGLVLALLFAGAYCGELARALDVYGELKSALFEKLSSSPTGTEGRVYYDTTEKKAKIYNGTAWQNVGSGSGSAGNLITNGDAEDASTPSGWAAYNDGASASAVDGTGGSASTTLLRTTTTGLLISGSGTWRVSKGASNMQGQGYAYSFTIPTNSYLKSALNEVSFGYYMAGLSDWRVYLYDVTNSTLITPTFTSCGGGSTPSLTQTTSPCAAKLSWVGTSGTSYRLIFHVGSTETTSSVLYFDDLFVGQRGVQVGPGQSEWHSVTVTPSITTNATTTALERQIGDSAEYDITIAISGTNTQGDVYVTLPTGRTIDTTKLAGGAATAWAKPVGWASFEDASGGAYYEGTALYKSTTQVGADLIRADSTYAGGNPFNTNTATPVALASGDKIRMRFSVPIAEFSGGVAYGENACEYAFNTSTSDANDSTSFGYGPAGQAFPGSALTGARAKTVQWQTAATATDTVDLEIDQDGTGKFANAATLGGGLVSAANIAVPLVYQNGIYYGIGLTFTSATQATIRLGQYAYPNSASYGAAGAAWSGTTAVAKWRLKKCRGGVPVGFGFGSGTDYGLVKGGVVPGNASGVAPSSGYVGYSLTNTNNTSSVSTVSDTSIVSLTLPVGTWLCGGTYLSDNIATQTGWTAKWFEKGSNTPSNAATQIFARYAAGQGMSGTFAPRTVTIASGDATKTVEIKAQSVAATGTGYGYISCTQL